MAGPLRVSEHWDSGRRRERASTVNRGHSSHRARRRDGTLNYPPLPAMNAACPLHPLLHRAVVVLLVACGFACCCRDRALAAWWAGDETPAAAACCGACAADSGDGDGTPREGPRESHDQDRERDQSHPSDACRSSCCLKSGFHAPEFVLPCDRVGAPLAGTVIAAGPGAHRAALHPTRLDEDVGKAPPWRLLLVSRRLRI
jgi:hypothetical protein